MSGRAQQLAAQLVAYQAPQSLRPAASFRQGYGVAAHRQRRALPTPPVLSSWLSGVGGVPHYRLSCNNPMLYSRAPCPSVLLGHSLAQAHQAWLLVVYRSAVSTTLQKQNLHSVASLRKTSKGRISRRSQLPAGAAHTVLSRCAAAAGMRCRPPCLRRSCQLAMARRAGQASTGVWPLCAKVFVSDTQAWLQHIANLR